ncbi:MAG TPA: alkaline phosphatase family protein [Terriglobales bacterium]|nr:alkaline phosphatase family protein [Terriglobales bacterium]
MLTNIRERFRSSGFALPVLMLSLSMISKTATASTCTPGPVDPSVTVCTPTQNLIVPTPTHVQASTTDSQHKVVAVQIYVDNALITQVNTDTIDTYINLAIGNHLVTVQAWDDSGATFKTNVNVSMSPPCKLLTQNQSITVCTPTLSGAVVSLPVHLMAGTTDSSPVQTIQILENGISIYQTSSQTLDAYLTNLTTGKHNLTITATDLNGVSFSKALSLRVGSTNGMTKLKHIIYFVQENRSFDNYFGMLGKYRVSKGLPNSIDGVPLGVTLYDTKGKPVHPFHFQTVCHENLSPYWNESHIDWDGGKMDNYMITTTSVPSTIDPTGTRAMGYYDQTDLPYYYELATQFATSDRFFSPVMTNTIGNRMYLFAATSFGHIFPDPPPQGGWPQTTIFDQMDAAGVSWRYYYQDNGIYLPEWSTYQRDAGKLYPISSWYTDVQNESTLPSVIFIERGGPSGLDEHPGNNIQIGAANTKKIIDGLMNSPSWASSVFILTYDEAGALYDHVLPATVVPPDNILPMLQTGDQPGTFAQDGFRLPITVISPWIRPNFVSHNWRDLTSILRLIEVRFNVSSLTARDAAADNMLEFFDFSTPHWLTPPPLPDQPTTGACDFTKEKAPGF